VSLSKRLPNDVVGEVVPLEIGPLEADLVIHSYEFDWTTVFYKPNRVHVRASTRTSNRSEGILRPIRFTVTEKKWKELNRSVNPPADQEGPQ